jgi:glycosyltransferase involved in cell wall biosynthesis
VTLHGHLSWAELDALYRNADVVVLPSLQEVWGQVVSEAQAHGMPVITTDQVGAAVDLVEPGVTGEVVPAGDRAELSAAMARIADWDEERWSRCAVAARALYAGLQMPATAERFHSACAIGVENRRRS